MVSHVGQSAQRGFRVERGRDHAVRGVRGRGEEAVKLDFGDAYGSGSCACLGRRACHTQQ